LKKIIIAIDGFSSTGKSTLAKQLASKLAYLYVDSGAMYRAVALYALQHGIINENQLSLDKLIASLSDIALTFVFNDALGYSEIYLNGQSVEQAIRTLEVSNAVSRIAEISEVRQKLVEIQRAMGYEKGLVMDGRDIGTVVFPQAELKLFMTASAEIRAQRRYEELCSKGEKVHFAQVLDNVQSRDRIDSTRKDSPLRKASDAIVIDNTELGVEAQFEKVFSLVQTTLEEA